MMLMIDNYDSFTHNLVRYFRELDQPILLKRNDEINLEDVKKINPSHIVISPGPKGPFSTGICLEVIHNLCSSIPILGVCLGHQCIGHVFGAKVTHALRPVHGKVSSICHKEVGLFTGLKNPLSVMRYHSLVIDRETLPSCLSITAETNEREIMAIAHKNFPLVGVQFHPESVLTEGGHHLLLNFMKGHYR